MKKEVKAHRVMKVDREPMAKSENSERKDMLDFQEDKVAQDHREFIIQILMK